MGLYQLPETLDVDVHLGEIAFSDDDLSGIAGEAERLAKAAAS